MLHHIRGKIVGIDEGLLVLDTPVIGFEINVPTRYFKNLKIGEEIFLFLHLQLSEHKIELYGFLTKKEREIFHLLLKVPKLGPKLALSILSMYTPEEILDIVEHTKIEKLVKVPGIGRKTAERIIFELKNGLLKENPIIKEVKRRLSLLGYSEELIEKIIPILKQKLSTETTVEEALREAVMLIVNYGDGL